MAPPLPFAAAPDGLRLAVRLTPKASAARIVGLAPEADGSIALKVAVTAPPEAGKANDALLALVADLLGLKRRDLTLTLGAAHRRKLVHIAGDPAALARRLEEVLQPWLTPSS
ncbi:MAG TPA: DUF167 family protein [Stellaceae bacterium]|nr:DUF167 family protein [Stellaceae bacterium]